MRALVLIAAACLAACAPAPEGDGPSPARLVDIEAMEGRGLQPRNITIWLPPEYDESGERYPVLYMHDGQNLFRPGFAYGGEEWGVDEAMERLIAAGEVRPAIVVGVWNTSDRYLDYGPSEPIRSLRPDARAQLIEAYGGEPVSDAYLRFLVEVLKPRIDAEYRTLAGPADTAVMGSSMGGLISLYAAGEHPEVFGAAAGLSTHWPTGPGGGGLIRQDAWMPLVVAAYTQYFRTSGLNPSSQRIWTDHGDQTLDALYPPYHDAIMPAFESLGFQRGVNLEARSYPGTAHNEAAWRARLEEPLVFLLGAPDPD